MAKDLTKIQRFQVDKFETSVQDYESFLKNIIKDFQNSQDGFDFEDYKRQVQEISKQIRLFKIIYGGKICRLLGHKIKTYKKFSVCTRCQRIWKIS